MVERRCSLVAVRNLASRAWHLYLKFLVAGGRAGNKHYLVARVLHVGRSADEVAVVLGHGLGGALRYEERLHRYRRAHLGVGGKGGVTGRDGSGVRVGWLWGGWEVEGDEREMRGSWAENSATKSASIGTAALT